MSGVSVLGDDCGDSDGNSDDGAERNSDPEASHRPPDQRARDDARRGESDQHASGAGEGERRSLGLHPAGAYHPAL